MFEKKDKRDILLVILPMCDCLKRDGNKAWKKLDALMRDISRTYVAISLNVELLVCGMTTEENDYEQERLDFHAKVAKFQSFDGFFCSCLLLHQCKDDLEALDHATSSIKTMYHEHYPKYVEIASIDDHIDKKTWMYSTLLDGTLQTTEQFFTKNDFQSKTLRGPISEKFPLKTSGVKIASFIERPVDIPDELKKHVLTFSSNESARADFLIDEQEAKWCRFILRFHPEWIITGVKRHAWMNEAILNRLNGKYVEELIGLIEAKDSLFIKKSNGNVYSSLYDGFYSWTPGLLAVPFSFPRMKDEVDIGKILWKANSVVDVLPLGIFAQHFLTEAKV